MSSRKKQLQIKNGGAIIEIGLAGENVFTVTLTDGTTADFKVKNGEKGRNSFV